MADRFRRGHGSGGRMTKQWLGLSSASNAFTASATAVGGKIDFDEPQTIMRVLGEISIFETLATVQFDSARLAFGLAVVSTDAATLGATAVPDPGSTSDVPYPWLYWSQHIWTNRSGINTDADGSRFFRRSLDIRTMRKVKPRESLIWVFHYVDAGGVPPVTMAHEICRVLVALP